MSPLLTPTQASDHLGEIPVATLAQWRHRGIGPKYLKIGRHVRYRVSDLEAWITAQYSAA